MINFINSFFGSPKTSKDEAKARLKMLLVHDHVDLPPPTLEAMLAEIVEVVARYADVDRDKVEIRLERADNQVRLTSSVPVRRVTGRSATA